MTLRYITITSRHAESQTPDSARR